MPVTLLKHYRFGIYFQYFVTLVQYFGTLVQYFGTLVQYFGTLVQYFGTLVQYFGTLVQYLLLRPAISFESNLQPTTVMLSGPKSIMQIVHWYWDILYSNWLVNYYPFINMLVCRVLLPVEVPLNLTSRRCNEYDVAILKQKMPI